MNYVTIDEYGFASGHIMKEYVNGFNQRFVVKTPLPVSDAGEFCKWCWNGNSWEKKPNYLGNAWYNPERTSDVHNPSKPDDAPPSGWVLWVPGQERVVGGAEKTSNKWEEVIKRRDRLLAESDWVVIRAMDQGQDAPLDWREYRQALRDITQLPNPFAIAWPSLPGNSVVFEVGASP